MGFLRKQTMGWALLAALSIPATTIASTFANGSFESPGGTGTYFFASGTDATVTGWVHNDNGTALDSYSFGADYGITPADGSFYITFGHSSTTGGSLSQTFDTVAGHQYTVAYMLNTQQGPPSTQSVNLDAVNALNSNSLGSVQTDFTYTDWTAGNSLSFTAASNSTTITFTDLTTTANSGPVNWDLDAVTVTDDSAPASSAAPEPASFLLIGGALVALSARRVRIARTPDSEPRP